MDVVSSLDLSGGCVEIKLEGSSVESDRGFAGARVDVVALLIVLGVYAVALAVVVARTSDLRSGVRWYWVFREENLLIVMVVGLG